MASTTVSQDEKLLDTLGHVIGHIWYKQPAVATAKKKWWSLLADQSTIRPLCLSIYRNAGVSFFPGQTTSPIVTNEVSFNSQSKTVQQQFGKFTGSWPENRKLDTLMSIPGERRGAWRWIKLGITTYVRGVKWHQQVLGTTSGFGRIIRGKVKIGKNTRSSNFKYGKLIKVFWYICWPYLLNQTTDARGLSGSSGLKAVYFWCLLLRTPTRFSFSFSHHHLSSSSWFLFTHHHHCTHTHTHTLQGISFSSDCMSVCESRVPCHHPSR